MLLTSVLLLANKAQAQTADPAFIAEHFYKVSDVSDVAQQPDGKRVIVGGFEYVNGLPARAIARLNADGSLDQAFQANVTITTASYPLLKRPAQVRILPNGKILLATMGNSQDTLVVSGLKRVELMQLNADGTPDPTFNVGAGSHNDNFITNLLVQPDGKILVAGPIASFNTSGRFRRIVRLLSNGAVDAGFDAALAPMREISAVALQPDGKMVVSADFYRFNSSQTDTRIIRLQANGSVDNTFQSYTTTALVQKLQVQADGKVIMAGVEGLSTGGPYSNVVMRLQTNGQPDPSFVLDPVAAAGGTVQLNYLTDLQLQQDGKILVGLYVPNQYRLLRLNATGSIDQTWQVSSEPNWGPKTICVQPDGRVLIGGNITQAGGQPGGLFLLSQTGALDTSFRPSIQIPGTVSAISLQPDGKIIVGGNFHEIGATVADNLARLNADGTLDVAFTNQCGTNRPVHTVKVQSDGKIVVGGAFSEIGGFQRTALARLLTTGSIDPGFIPNTLFTPSSSPYTLTTVKTVLPLSDGSVWVGGNFRNTAGGYGLAKATTTGVPDPSLTVPSTGLVNTLCQQTDGNIVVGGSFTDFGGIATLNLARMSASGITDTGFIVSGIDDPFYQVMTAYQQPNGKLLVGGWFSPLAGVNSSLRRLELNGNIDYTFASNSTVRYARTVAIQPSGDVLVGGEYVESIISGSATPSRVVWAGLGLVSNTGQVVTNFSSAQGAVGAAYNQASVEALVRQPDGKVLVGGYFAIAGGQPHLSLARLMPPAALSTTTQHVLEQATSVYPNPARDILQLELAADRQPQLVQLQNLTGQVVFKQQVKQAKLSISVQHLPAGVYLLRVDYADGPVVRRVVLE
ncbi:delta-60 repeat domain-containing protein/Por secretion system C-terminal sorting domain-containing protein [Hymenobacter psychrotolerans DSM 18569]|uniref:Delta-60 repeat domain-containing protein/Por secretion system C-terminal sorting domain-containing protein n=2 Tax=Hymenobacter psychrotolerans TaxID=344998 RepID=A0A1M6PER1_9BACT|nr:delta-60 repeat domain-containing protein/Por secretion system C-terminal sorting domain-containing protein [Hymenobacter psychrotolerans DSM 18569]